MCNSSAQKIANKFRAAAIITIISTTIVIRTTETKEGKAKYQLHKLMDFIVLWQMQLHRHKPINRDKANM